MASLTSFPLKAANGDVLGHGYLNGLAGLSSKQEIIARLTGQILALNAAFTVDSELFTNSTDNFAYDIMYEKSSGSHVDKTNTTALYGDNGYIAFCDVFDNFDNSSLDATKWNTTGTSGTGAVSEGTASVQLTATTDGSGTENAVLISNGASGLDMHGTTQEIIVFYDMNATVGNNDSASCTIQISNGSTHVTVVSVSENASNTSETDNGYLRIVFDSATNTCAVWRARTTSTTPGGAVTYAEEVVSASLDVSAVTTNKYLRFIATATEGGAGNGSATINVYGVGRRLNGAGAANADFVAAAQTLDASSSKAVWWGFWHKKPASAPGVVFTCDGSTSYGSDDIYGAWGSATAGTSLKTRVRVAKPTTITAGQTNIPILVAWGLQYG